MIKVNREINLENTLKEDSFFKKSPHPFIILQVEEELRYGCRFLRSEIKQRMVVVIQVGKIQMGAIFEKE